MSVLERLRKRRLFQWTLAYLAGAFVVLQVMDGLEGPLGLSDDFQRLVLIAMVVGLPLALALAWYHGEEGRQPISVQEALVVASLVGFATLTVVLASPREGADDEGGEQDNPARAPDAVPVSADAVPELDPRRIAVLPFVHMSADDESQYFTDGIHDDLLSQLAQVSELRVISRTSVARYADTQESIPEIAAALNAGTVVEGGVQRAGSRTRINVQVIDGASDTHIWSQTFDQMYSVETLFEVQAQIVREVAVAVRATLLESESERLGEAPTQSIDAYELYKRARHAWLRGTRADHERTAALYRQAIGLDSTFAEAYSGLAEVYGDMAGYLESDTLLARGRSAAETALSLDPELADAHAALGYMAHWFEWDTVAAADHFEAAVRLSPSNAIARYDYGRFLLNFGDLDDAIAQLRLAAELDPGTVFVLSDLGYALYMHGEVAEAIEVLEERIRLQPQAYAQLHYAYALHLAGRRAEALRAAELALIDAADAVDSVNVIAGLAELTALSGDRDRARALLVPVKDHELGAGLFPVRIAWVHIALEEPDSAFVWLDRAMVDQNRLLLDRRLRSEWADPIRDDPRYGNLVQRIGSVAR